MGGPHTSDTHTCSLDHLHPCVRCGEGLSVVHILMTCNALDTTRKKQFTYLYGQQIPHHPSLFLGDDAMVSVKSVFKHFSDANF